MSAAAASKTGLVVNIRKWQAVGVWTWNAGDDVCGICRMPYDGCPSEVKFPGDDSPVVWGVCTHAFHLHERVSEDTAFWLFLLNMTLDPPGHAPLPPRLVCVPGVAPSAQRAETTAFSSSRRSQRNRRFS